MAENDTIMKALETMQNQSAQNSRDQFTAINKLGERFLEFGSDIKEALTSVKYTSRTPAQSQNDWKLVVAMSSIMFGLMTPLYFMMNSIAEKSNLTVARLLEDDRADEITAVNFAEFRATSIQRFHEIETQFSAGKAQVELEVHRVDAQLDSIRNGMLRDDEAENTNIHRLATIEEKLKQLGKGGV